MWLVKLSATSVLHNDSSPCLSSIHCIDPVHPVGVFSLTSELFQLLFLANHRSAVVYHNSYMLSIRANQSVLCFPWSIDSRRLGPLYFHRWIFTMVAPHLQQFRFDVHHSLKALPYISPQFWIQLPLHVSLFLTFSTFHMTFYFMIYRKLSRSSNSFQFISLAIFSTCILMTINDSHGDPFPCGQNPSDHTWAVRGNGNMFSFRNSLLI